MPVASNTPDRAVKRLSRVFMDRGWKKHVASMGYNRYPMIVRDEFSRYA